MKRICAFDECNLELIQRPGERNDHFARRKYCCPSHGKRQGAKKRELNKLSRKVVQPEVRVINGWQVL